MISAHITTKIPGSVYTVKAYTRSVDGGYYRGAPECFAVQTVINAEIM